MRAAEQRIETLGRRRLHTGIWRACASPARPLVILNGIGLNMDVLGPLAAALDDRTILAMDPPGIGGSPDGWLPYTPWMAANWIAGLLDRHGIAEADVFGFSWGGAIAQQFAIQHKRRVGKLVLAGIGAGWPMVPGQASVISWLTDPDWMRQLRADPRRAAFAGIGEADRRALTPDFLSHLRLPRSRGYLLQLCALAGWSSVPALPFLDKPSLVVMGAEDQVVPVVNGQILAALIPQSRLHVIEGAGHLFMFSHLEEVSGLLRAFLASDKQEPSRAA